VARRRRHAAYRRAQDPERLRRIDTGHMEITFTFDDPKTFTTPWSATVRFNLLPDTELLEHHCDNEKWAKVRG
jgi:hypothetical protein